MVVQFGIFVMRLTVINPLLIVGFLRVARVDLRRAENLPLSAYASHEKTKAFSTTGVAGQNFLDFGTNDLDKVERALKAGAWPVLFSRSVRMTFELSSNGR